MAAHMPPAVRYRFVFAALLLLALCACGVPRGQFSGRVAGVLDGDTIEVLREGKPVRVRLHGIDCPERRQAFGTVARKFTSERAFGKTVTVLVRDRDRYGRTVGEVLLPDDGNLNHELLRAGLAWWYRRFAEDPRLEQAEAEARQAGRGLWSDPRPVAPWDYRREQRTAPAR